jgi:hypothetical protein
MRWFEQFLFWIVILPVIMVRQWRTLYTLGAIPGTRVRQEYRHVERGYRRGVS